MKLIDKAAKAVKRFLPKNAYDAVERTNQRSGPSSKLSTEDKQLKGKKRNAATSETRDARRNFPLARWAIAKHIDYVASHSFNAKTGNADLDKQLERLVEINSTAENFDALGRHPLRRFLRLLEAGRLTDGDIWALKTKGGMLQAIEGDRVRDPEKANRAKVNDETWVTGVRIGTDGRYKTVAIHRRDGKGNFKFERTVAAKKVIQHGFYDRFDQVRGISPIISSLNSMRDLYKGFDYALGKLMVSQLIAFQVTRDSNDAFGTPSDSQTEYEIDFGNGPAILDMDRGDELKMVESKNPSKETGDFWQSMIRMSLLSLNIPYSFFDGSSTNFFGSRAELQHYLKSVDGPRKDIQDFLNCWLKWRIEAWVDGGDLVLPEGLTADDLRWEWIPDGVAWWNPVQEVNAALMSVAGSLRSRREIRRETYGDDWFKVADEIAEENQYLIDSGLPVEIPSNTLAGLEAEAETENKKETEDEAA